MDQRGLLDRFLAHGQQYPGGAGRFAAIDPPRQAASERGEMSSHVEEAALGDLGDGAEVAGCCSPGGVLATGEARSEWHRVRSPAALCQRDAPDRVAVPLAEPDVAVRTAGDAERVVARRAGLA
ncbi:MAG: hypothetical protein ACR2J5_11040 [Geodermatophilaceae bacterium]